MPPEQPNTGNLNQPPQIHDQIQPTKRNPFSPWYSSHGAEITNDPTLDGTSYVIGVFR
jgi:hypothetical protein